MKTFEVDYWTRENQWQYKFFTDEDEANKFIENLEMYKFWVCEGDGCDLIRDTYDFNEAQRQDLAHTLAQLESSGGSGTVD